MEELSFDNMMSAEQVMNAWGIDEDDSAAALENKEETAEIKTENKATNTESPVSIFGDSESVGESENDERESEVPDKKTGSSQNNFSSIARTLKECGTFEDLSDDDINDITDGLSLVDAIDKQARARFDEKLKRIDDALNAGIEVPVIRQYETILDNLDKIGEDAIKSETDNGEQLRRNLIYQDCLNRGYSKERAEKEVNKSFNAGTDIEDALEALESNKDFYIKSYNDLVRENNNRIEELQKALKKLAEDLLKSIMEDEKAFNDLVVDKNTRRRILEAISKPVYRDPDTKRQYTAILKYAMENPADFLKYLGLVFTLTNSFKDFNGLVKGLVKKEVKEKIKQMENVINTSKRGGETSLFGETPDPDASFPSWKIGDF